jgi:hypothetical protein
VDLNGRARTLDACEALHRFCTWPDCYAALTASMRLAVSIPTVTMAMASPSDLVDEHRTWRREAS